MTCQQIEAEGVIEQYLANRLTNAARKQFEVHYFGCDQCFEGLEAYRAAATVLRRPPRTRRWIWAAAAAAVVIIGLRFMPHPVSHPPPKGEPAPLLVRVDPPPYSVPTLRSVPNAETRQFYAAMEPYQRHDYPASIEALKKFLDGSPKQTRPFLDAEFFLGASYLLVNRPDEATAALDTVLAADSPYLEEAHFLRAEAWLKKGDAGHARTELEKVIAMGGDLKARAQALLANLKQP
jgi:tetratricopeptide (TPR) repeat protein